MKPHAADSMFTRPDVDPQDILTAIETSGFELGPARRPRRTVLDTFDGRLHAAGLRLEIREVPPPSKGLPRRQLALTGRGPAPAHVPVDGVPRFGRDLPRGPLRARLSPLLDVRALLPVVSVTADQRVAVRRDELGKAVASMTVHDQLVIEESTGPHPRWVVEVDEMAGYPKAAREARQLLLSLGLQPLDCDLMALAAAVVGADLGGHVGSASVPLDRAEPALEAFRRVLANLAGEIDANWEGTLHDVDPEFLHDLRVAVRRTRSVLAQGKRVLPSAGRDRFREEFGWLGAATGPARDLDVYVIGWDSYVGPLGAHVTAALAPLVNHLADRRRAEHATLATVLRAERYHGLMAAWHGWLRAPSGDEEPGADACQPIGRVAARRIATANDRLLARGRGIRPDTPAEELHELRKDAKKLRYLLECFGALLPQAGRKAFVQRLKAVQDNLGEHQDTEVHAAQLGTMSRQLHNAGTAGPEALVAMGHLAGEFERRRSQARAEFATRFAAYDTAETRRSLEALVDAAKPDPSGPRSGVAAPAR